MKGAPNLDNGFTQKELVEFWNRTDKRTAEVARELFDRDGKSVREAVRNLGHYASTKAAAMLSREMGEIQTAAMYEGICERIYDQLPKFARW